MDLVLPGIDCCEATQQIRNCFTTEHVPVIALSSNASTEDRAQSLQAGCNDFDTKPMDFLRLLRKIEPCLSLASPQIMFNYQDFNDVPSIALKFVMLLAPAVTVTAIIFRVPSGVLSFSSMSAYLHLGLIDNILDYSKIDADRIE